MADAARTVLLTGASTGVGLTLSQLLLPLQHFRLIFTARFVAGPVCRCRGSDPSGYWQPIERPEGDSVPDKG